MKEHILLLPSGEMLEITLDTLKNFTTKKYSSKYGIHTAKDSDREKILRMNRHSTGDKIRFTPHELSDIFYRIKWVIDWYTINKPTTNIILPPRIIHTLTYFESISTRDMDYYSFKSILDMLLEQYSLSTSKRSDGIVKRFYSILKKHHPEHLEKYYDEE